MDMVPDDDEEYTDFVRRVADSTNQRYLEAQSLIKSNGLWKRSRPGCNDSEKRTMDWIDGPLTEAIMETGEIPGDAELRDVERLGHILSSRMSRCKDAESKRELARKHRAVWDTIREYRRRAREEEGASQTLARTKPERSCRREESGASGHRTVDESLRAYDSCALAGSSRSER